MCATQYVHHTRWSTTTALTLRGVKDFLVQQGLLTELPAIAGHEGAGIIRAIGSEVKDKSLQIGDPVLLSFTACGGCSPCKGSNFSRCTDFGSLNLGGVVRPDGSSPARLLDGRPVRGQFFGQSSFSRFTVAHEFSVVKCPHPEDMAIYSPMGCGYQTGAGTILNVLKPGPEQTVAVFGAGSVGFSAIMAAASIPVKQIIAIDIVDQKLELAKGLGATHTINSATIKGSVVDEVNKLTGGKGVDFVIDTTGVSAVVEKMLDCLAYAGTAASVGAPPRADKITVNVGSFFAGQKKWLAITEGDSHPPEVVPPQVLRTYVISDFYQFIPQLIDLHLRGKFPVDKICKVYPVADLDKAITDMKAGVVRPPPYNLLLSNA